MLNAITINVCLDNATFRRFAFFDAFILRKCLRRPVIFCSIFLVFSLVAFFSHREQSMLLGSVLLMVGLGIPAVYIGTFLVDVNRQGKKAGLRSCPLVYTVHLDKTGIVIQNAQKEEKPLHLRWNTLSQAFRMKDCVYLYAAPNKAFLFPNGQANVSDEELWQTIVQYMGSEKCQVRK